MSKITFIGAGNIAQALMGGFLESQPDAEIIASDPNEAQLEKLAPQIERQADNNKAVAAADIIVLCVKPDLMGRVCRNLTGNMKGKLFISVAAGVTIDTLASCLGSEVAVIRSMPNTPALVQSGMTGLYANAFVSENQKQGAELILSSVGKVLWFEKEGELDIVTAISGSGPAYFFLFMQAMQKAGEDLGLSSDVSTQLVLQTAKGAAEMAMSSTLSTEELRNNVTSPGGTTAAAINAMLEGEIEKIIQQGVEAAHKRSISLSKA